MGPPQAEDVLKKALAMGCDESALLSDRVFGGADTLATGYVLAKAAEKIGDYDLLIFGRHASDGETAQSRPHRGRLPGHTPDQPWRKLWILRMAGGSHPQH